MSGLRHSKQAKLETAQCPSLAHGETNCGIYIQRILFVSKKKQSTDSGDEADAPETLY